MLKKRREEEAPRRRKKKFGPYGIFRMFLSLLMMGVLFLGVYSAYKSFSGTDPLQLNPQSLLENAVGSDMSYKILNGVLSFSPHSVLGHQIGPDAGSLSLSAPVETPAQSASPGVVVQLPVPVSKPTLNFTFAIVADTHNDNDDLKEALKQAKNAGAKFVLGLGDFTDVGTVAELSSAKQQFDASGLSYYVIPGDHDLWDSRNRGLDPLTDFKSVFGQSYQSLVYSNTGFVMINNSDNYTGVDSDQMDWIHEQLQKISANHQKLIFVFASTPLYHPSSDHYMGKVTPSLRAQADALISLLSQYHTAEVFAGDTHFYYRYTEPKTNLKMTAVGAVTNSENLEEPRFTLVDVYSDGSYNIKDTEIK